MKLVFKSDHHQAATVGSLCKAFNRPYLLQGCCIVADPGVWDMQKKKIHCVMSIRDKIKASFKCLRSPSWVGGKKKVVVLVKFWLFSKMYNVVILAQWLRR